MPDAEVNVPEENLLLRVLNQEGMFYVLNITRWSARARINEDELNLPKKVNKKLLALGSKKLMLKDHINMIDQAQREAYDILRPGEYVQPIFGMRFIQARHVHRIETELTAAKARFFQAVDDFMEQYPAYIEDMRILWAKEVEELFPGQPVQREAALNSIMASYPEGMEVRGKFSFDWMGFSIKLPDTKIASGVANIRQVQETSKAIERMQGKIEKQLGDMVMRDAANLEAAVRDLCQSVLDTSEASPTGLHQKTINRLRKEIEKLRQINYANVPTVIQALDRLEVLSEEDAKAIRERDDGVDAFRDTVRSIQSVIEQSLLEDKEETLKGFIATGRRKIEVPF